MKKVWATLIGLALAVPMGAYVAGTLVGDEHEPSDHTPIKLQESDPTTSDPTSSESPTKSDKKNDRKNDDRDDHDDRPKTVQPVPDDLDDDDDDRGRDQDDDHDDDDDDDHDGDD